LHKFAYIKYRATKIIITIIFIIIKVIYCPTYNKPEQPGITESTKNQRCIKMNVTIMSFETSFKTVRVGGRTDVSRERVPDRRSGN